MPSPKKSRKRPIRRSGKSTFTFDNPIPGKIAELPDYLNKSVAATLKYYEPQVENYARLNAPWKDRTANARNGLIAQSGRQNGTHFLVLAHRVPYGIWLEVKWDGRNAIILPTLELYGPKVMGTLEKILDKFK